MNKIKIKEHIKKLPEYIPGKTIQEIKEKYNLKEVYKLASNENILGPSPKISQIIKTCLDDINYYPDSYNRQLRKKLSAILKISEDSLIFGNGTDQVIEMVCDALLDDKKNIVIPDPTFLTYEKSALKNNAGIIKVSLKNFKQDVDSIKKAVNNKTSIIFLTSPHNPTGTILSGKEIESLLTDIREDILLVLDEAYVEFMDEEDRPDSLGLLKKYSNLMIMRTFSKIYGLAGLRIGYGIADMQLIKDISKLAQPFVVNQIAQQAALLSLDDTDYFDKSSEAIKSQRDKMSMQFEKGNIVYVKSSANFILIHTGKNTKIIVEELLKNGFIVRDGEFLGFPNHIRVSVSTSEINEKFLDCFFSIYKKHN